MPGPSSWTPGLQAAAIYGNLGMFLLGYNTVVQNNSLLPLAEHFGLDATQRELVSSLTVLFAAFASVFSPPLNANLGRRKMLLISAAFAVLGATCVLISRSFAFLLFGRSALGIAAGLASNTAPMYLAELSPPEHRGIVVGLADFNAVAGQLLASIVNTLCMRANPNGSWRFPMGIALAPALLQLLGQATLPESPRWLMQRGLEGEAERVLQDMYGQVLSTHPLIAP